MLRPFRRPLSLFAASVLVAATALLGSVGTAQAAGNAFDADFAACSPASDPFGSVSFERNGISYVTTGAQPRDSGSPLFSQQIEVVGSGNTWTYSFKHGSSSTSVFWTDPGKNGSVSNVTYVVCPTTTGLKFAQIGSLVLNGNDFDFAETVTITTDGRITHDLGLANTNASTVAGLNFFVELDTMLNDDDYIPIYKGSDGAAYIENADFRLYLALLKGDTMLAGRWSSLAIASYKNVADYKSGDIIVDGVDSAVSYGVLNRTLAPGEKLSLSYEERIYAKSEIVDQVVNVVYVDDTTGTLVTPVAGTTVTLTGDPLTAVGFTEADALAGIPAGYDFVSLDNVAQFDDVKDTDQTITVHLAHHHTLGTLTTTRTITYTGAEDLTPVNVVQTVQWTTDTDDVTGVTVYTPLGSYPAVSSPVISGYTLGQGHATVQTALFGPTTNKPGNTTVQVTYINSIDIQTGGSVLTSTAATSGTALAILLFGIGVFSVCATRLRRV